MATVTAPSARRLQRFVASGGVVWTLVLTLVVIGAAGSEDFRTLSNLSNVSRQAVVLLYGCAVAFGGAGFLVSRSGLDVARLVGAVALGMVIVLIALLEWRLRR